MNEPEKLSILIVDDEKPNIDALSRILKEKYKLFVAKSGEDALKIARKNTPNLIVLDLFMPGMDGFSTLERLKESDDTKNIPVIVITRQDGEADRVKGLNLGAAAYITTPFNIVMVEASVGTHMKIVEQARAIERTGRIDLLTGLPNMSYFEEHLGREWGRAIRETSPVSMLAISIDGFKEQGIATGEVLLRAAAWAFKQVLRRAADFVARRDGGEFAILLPNTDEDGARDIAERVRAEIENAGATVSIGIISERPVIDMPAEEFIEKADKALNAAKESGKNKVCIYK